MKFSTCLLFSATLIGSMYTNANVTNSKEFQDLKKITDQLQQKQNDLANGKTNPNDRNAPKGWECRDMEEGGKRMTVYDKTGVAKMNHVPSTEAAYYGTKRPTASLPPCRLDLVVPKLTR